MVGIGYYDLDNKPDTPEKVECTFCDETHTVVVSNNICTTLPLQYYKCKGDMYLVGINGKSLYKGE